MENNILEISERIRGLRQIMGISVEEMAQVIDTAENEYLKLENGENDFSFTFLYKCAKRFGIDITELITGDMPKLSFYSVVRKGEGMPLERRKGFKYQHLAAHFKNKSSEPFLVLARYNDAEQEKEIALSNHKGEEFNFVVKGTLKVQLENHTEILNEGDSIYYDASRGHGMIATAGRDCEFLAVVIEK